MVNILWKVILFEWFCYIVLNLYLVAKWVTLKEEKYLNI